MARGPRRQGRRTQGRSERHGPTHAVAAAQAADLALGHIGVGRLAAGGVLVSGCLMLAMGGIAHSVHAGKCR
ncbi:hypothetical protein [Halomonas sp. MCCC 1A11062]|uniref:hypothetical protein n=1 Tax=Halomonas sp. MCCC 1A11062 TaxID=2733485 RepID=UPI001F1A4B5B|nr:hypothetical protein [Halomonas sp. MCCC 1A11062]MCE8039988.1 hypothetical protein [Halomonas sp. MCCC 1A11062]